MKGCGIMKSVSIQLPENVLTNIKKLAKQNGISVAAQIRMIILKQMFVNTE